MNNMRRIQSLLFFILLFTVASCNKTPPPIPASTPTLPVVIIPTVPTCTLFASAPTPGPDAPSLFPPITNADHIRGPENATVTIITYGDYQDGNSAAFEEAVLKLLAASPNDLRVVSRVFPLTNIHDKAALAALAAEAANTQNKFWEMHDLLYAQQKNWINMSAADFEQWITTQVSALGMNVDQFQNEWKSEAAINKLQQVLNEAQKIGLPGVPLVVINGQVYLGPRDFTSMNDIIRLIALGKRQFTTCPPMTVEGTKQYIATLHTEKGDVVIQLFADKTPYTVNSFIFLAKSGWYDNITFHRVIPGLYAQTGDPSGTGKGAPGYYVITEILPELTFDNPGMVAMVNSGPDSSGSQFFITYAPVPKINGQYTIFGQVLSGMNVLKSLTPRDPQPGIETPTGDKLLSVTIEGK